MRSPEWSPTFQPTGRRMPRNAFPRPISRTKYSPIKRVQQYPDAVAIGNNMIELPSGRRYIFRDDGWRRVRK